MISMRHINDILWGKYMSNQWRSQEEGYQVITPPPSYEFWNP